AGPCPACASITCSPWNGKGCCPCPWPTWRWDPSWWLWDGCCRDAETQACGENRDAARGWGPGGRAKPVGRCAGGGFGDEAHPEVFPQSEKGGDAGISREPRHPEIAGT